ncbi:MAG: Lrp/AsnC family transcriptional regulator [Thaumarchaeota archaeon]|nr:Lrp/AsnC family transcriptional regulator [Candidatus Wolframiiraptor allenii]
MKPSCAGILMVEERYALDPVDLKIIELLKKDGRMPFVELGKRVGLSEAAVRRRVKILQERGIIKRFTVDVDEGFQVSAVIFLQFESSSFPGEIVEKIARVPGIRAIYELTGRFDAMVIISASRISELNERIDKIRAIEGVKSTETAVVLRVLTPSLP